MKQTLYFLVILMTITGCSKSPTDQNTNIGSIISIELVDTTGVAYGGWNKSGFDNCFGIQVRILCVEQYYTDIVPGSDSMSAILYTNKGKRLYFDWKPSHYSTIISETLKHSYFEAHKTVYASTDTGIGYNPATGEHYLTLNDTLSHPDSIRIYVHWSTISAVNELQWYSKQQTFINPPYTETYIIY
jgi:hypothetical protein